MVNQLDRRAVERDVLSGRGSTRPRARPPTKELFLTIPTHIYREIIRGRKKEGSTVFSINSDRCRHLDLAVSSLPAALA